MPSSIRLAGWHARAARRPVTHRSPPACHRHGAIIIASCSPGPASFPSHSLTHFARENVPVPIIAEILPHGRDRALPGQTGTVCDRSHWSHLKNSAEIDDDGFTSSRVPLPRPSASLILLMWHQPDMGLMCDFFIFNSF
jgi:hypothetical protein